MKTVLTEQETKERLKSRYKEVNQYRKKSGEKPLTHEIIAQKCNLTVDYVNTWFCKSRNNLPALQQFVQLSEMLDCDVDYLLGLQEQPRKEYSHIADMTGLSYDAAAYLHNMAENKELNEAYLNVLSGLICQMQIAEKGRDSSLLLDMSNLIYGDFSPDSEEDAAMFNAFYKSEFMGLYGQLERFVENFRDRINSEKED